MAQLSGNLVLCVRKRGHFVLRDVVIFLTFLWCVSHAMRSALKGCGLFGKRLRVVAFFLSSLSLLLEDGRLIHVVCRFKEDGYLIVVTVYALMEDV
jgi:hypothetical protein